MTAAQLLVYIGIAGGVVAIVGGGGILGWLWRTQPERERNRAANDAIIGKAQVTDRAGTVMSPAQPGLVHLQQENAKALVQASERLTRLEQLVETLAQVDGRLGGLEQRVTLLEESNIKDVITAAERAATAVASAEMLRMMRDPATDAEADEPAGEL